MRETIDPRYVAMAMTIAHGFMRHLPRSVLVDDLRQAAMLGLVKALRKDPDGSGSGYEWYLRCRIRGAIIDELRAEDWLQRRGREREKATGARVVRVVHLEDIKTSTGQTIELPGPEWDPVETIDRDAELARLWQTPMSARELRILRACYGGERSRRHVDVALDEGVSEARISQIVGRVMLRIRQHLEEGPETSGSKVTKPPHPPRALRSVARGRP